MLRTMRAMNEQSLIIFDGSCDFCTACVTALRKLDWRHRLRFAPFQRPGIPESAGLTFTQCEQAVWMVPPSGEVVSSAHAVNAALAQVTVVPLSLWLYRLPGVRQVEEALYRWVARHRSAFPGVTPHCASYPGDCGKQR